MILSRKEVAEWFGISESTVKVWMQEGFPWRSREDVRPADLIQWAMKNKSNGGPETLTGARTRKTQIEAELKALQLAIQKGALVPRDEAVEWGIALASEMKIAFMATPRRLAPVVVGQEIRIAEEKIREEVHRILNRVSDKIRRTKNKNRDLIAA